jgi:hypothetical protein
MALSKKDEAVLLKLFKRMTEEDKAYVQEHKELPPMKLSSEEMAAIKGGWEWLDKLCRLIQKANKH